jgi:hypothetical protein
VNNLSYVIDPEQFTNKIVRLQNRDALNNELVEMRKISHRWNLVMQFAPKGTRTVAFLTRQLKVFANCTLCLLKQQTGTWNVVTAEGVKQLSANEAFTKFKEYCETLQSAIENQDIEQTTKWIQIVDGMQKSFPFDRKPVFPMNVQLYQPILNSRIRQLLATQGASSLIKNALKLMRTNLDISDAEDQLCLIMQILELVKTQDYDITIKLEELLIERMKEIVHTNKHEYAQVVFGRIRQYYKTKLYDFFDSIDEQETFERYLQIYYIKADFSDCKEMIESSVTRDFMTIKKSVWKEPYQRHMRLGNQILEGVVETHTEFYETLSEYDRHASAHGISVMLKLYIYELVDLVRQKDTTLNTELIEHFSILERFLKLLADEDAKYSNVLPLFLPLQEAMNPIITKWINTMQENFNIYLERAVKLENWESVKGYSSSYLDLFTFLEQPVTFLKQLYLPSSGQFLRAYAQCMSGMVQKYGHMIMDGIPDANELIPPPIVREVKSGPNLTKLLKKKEPQHAKVIDVKRVQIGKKFGYLELFTRLHNLVAAKKRFTEQMTDLKKSWNRIRSVFLLQEIDEKDKEDEHTETETQTRNDSEYSSDEDSTSETDKTETETETATTRTEKTTITRYTGPSDPALPDFDFDNLTTITCSVIVNSIHDLCDFIGTRNICIELYDQLFGSLYYPTVKDSIFTPLLPKYFDPCLTSLCDLAPDQYTVQLVMKSMFRKLMRTLYIVLLDSDRMFFSHDFTTLLNDIYEIEKYFADGLKSEYIQQYTFRLKCIVASVMDKSTKELIEGGKLNQMYIRLPEKKPETNGSPFTKEIVWKVLYGRKKHDPLAKKFIKTHIAPDGVAVNK